MPRSCSIRTRARPAPSAPPLCAGDGKPHGKASGFRGFDTIAALTYTSTTAAETVCKWCPINCTRTFIDVQLPGAKGRAWSKVPLAEGWERVISGNSCPKGLVEDVNEMRVVKAKLEEVSVSTLTLPRWFARTRSAESAPAPSRASLRVGVPRVLNLWSTHQFWMGLFTALGVDRATSSSRPTPRRSRAASSARGAAPWTAAIRQCISGHYGELLFGQKQKLDILFSPMIYTLPSFMSGHVARTLTCPRVMAAPENIKAGFVKERDVFAEAGIAYAAPFVSLDEPRLVPKQLFEGMRDVLPGLTREEMARAVDAGYKALFDFNDRLRRKSREVLEWCAREDRRACSCSRGRTTWTPGSATRSRSISRRTAIRCSGSSTRPSTTI